MKPDWEELADEFDGSKRVVIGEVDCTTDGGKPLCERFGVTGYPTLKYFNPPDREGEVYDGERSLKALKKFAKSLGPMCTADSLERCSKKKRVELQPYLDTPIEKLEEQLAEMKSTLETTQQEHDALLEKLQAEFKASDERLKAVKEDLGPKIKLTKAAIPAKKDNAVKDEM